MATQAASTKLPDIYQSVHVTPLLEIFAVTVEVINDDDLLTGTCEIYGRIGVMEELDDITFDIFHRDKDNPESISFGETLSLTFPLDMEDAAIIPSDVVRLYVDLYDRSRLDMCIAKATILLDRTTSDHWLENYQVKSFPGDNNLKAKVQYAIFPYAVTATVNVLFFSKDDPFDTFKYDDGIPNDANWEMERNDMEDNFTNYDKNDCSITAKLFGSVFASGAIHRSDGKNNYRSSLLFRKPFEDSVEVKSGEFIQLSRSVVAVPACSSLQIKASFYDGDTKLPIVIGDAVFKARNHGIYKKDIVGDNGDRIRVQVAWSFAWEEFYRVTIQQSLSPVSLETNESIMLKSLRLLEQNPSAASTLSDKDTLTEDQVSDLPIDNCILPPVVFPMPLLEVFSVVVCSNDGKPFKFYGSVIVADWDRFCIFEILKSCPQDCPSSGMLAVVRNTFCSFTMRCDLAIIFDIEDVCGASISKGFVSFRLLDPYDLAGLPLCSVVRGERGFAAVHYSLIPDGVSAAVDIKVYRKSLPITVKGEIYATHVTSESSRSYQEKFFKSILFYNEKDGVTLDASGFSSLPLVKSRVSLPRLSYLIIGVNMSVSHNDASAAVSLKRRVVFKGNDDSPRHIKIDDLDMVVSVKFFYAS